MIEPVRLRIAARAKPDCSSLIKKLPALLGVNVNTDDRRCCVRPCHPDLSEGAKVGRRAGAGRRIAVTVTTRFSGGMCYETPIETIGELAFRQRGIVGGALPTVQR